jgi:hypothetical protein
VRDVVVSQPLILARFKYHFTAIFPHPRFLLVRSLLPQHPFLRSACLFFVSRCPSHVPVFTAAQIQNLEANLVDNLNAYHRGCRPSAESTLAALILSYLPPGSSDGLLSLSDVDPARMIGLAFGQMREMGHSLSLSRLLKSLESGIALRHLTDQLDDARLYLGVMTRQVW